MPYIKREDRKVFNPIIKRVVTESLAEKDPLARAELVGDFFKSTILGYAHYALGITISSGIKQNSLIVLSLIRTNYRVSDYFDVAGALNYMISTILWGVEGDAEEAEQARYGFRSMMKSILLELMDDLMKIPAGGSSANRLRTTRMLRGMLSDVVDENYRRRTSVFENEKMQINGDLWPLDD
jgi:hypothetical protein